MGENLIIIYNLLHYDITVLWYMKSWVFQLVRTEIKFWPHVSTRILLVATCMQMLTWFSRGVIGSSFLSNIISCGGTSVLLKSNSDASSDIVFWNWKWSTHLILLFNLTIQISGSIITTQQNNDEIQSLLPSRNYNQGCDWRLTKKARSAE